MAITRSTLSRRRLLEAAAATGLGALAPGCAKEEAAEAAEGLPPGASAVAVTAAAETEDAVRRAMELAGGLEQIRPGDTVFIKPNVVHPFATEGAIVTGSAVLGAVIRMVRDHGAGTIIVGDRSSREFRSPAAFRQSGVEQAALDAGADEVYPAPRPIDDPDAWTLVQPPRWEEWWEPTGGILAMRRLLEADHVINVPVCKNHRWAVFSLALKAYIGVIGDESRDQMHYVATSPDDLARAIAIMSQIRTPLLNVIDATVALVNGGPEGVLADAVRTAPGLVLASQDRVAIDVVGAALLRHEASKVAIPEPDVMHDRLMSAPVWNHAQIINAIERGLGIASAADLVFRFDGVAPAEARALEALVRA